MMGRKVDQKTIEAIINDYISGMKMGALKTKYNLSDATIRQYLKVNKVYQPKFWTVEKEQLLREVYPTGDWDLIMHAFPGKSKSTLHSQAHKMGIKMEDYYWSLDDENILRKFYGTISLKTIQNKLSKKYSLKAISTKAIKMGLAKSREWTQHEVNIMLENYSKVDVTAMAQLLPDRTVDAIKLKAEKLGLKSLFAIEQEYTEEQKQFILDNWMNMSDEEIAKIIGKTKHGVRDQRYKMGLRYPKKIDTYDNLNQYVRSHIYDWKFDAMKKYDFKCDITKQKFDVVHHLYGFNLIFDETIEYLQFPIYDSISDYTQQEVELFLNTFKEIQSQYPTGVCLKDEVHKLFHSIYGLGNNTEMQYYEFKRDCLNGKYEQINCLMVA